MLVTAISRFPVKSCAPIVEQQATVERYGLRGDRRWMAVDDDGAQLTAREYPSMLRVRPTEVPDGLLLTHPDAPELHVRFPSGEKRAPVSVWDHAMEASLVGPEADAWFSKITGVSARLVYLDDPSQRHPNPRFGRPDDVVTFADGYPVNVASEASLAALNDLIAAGDRGFEAPIPMRRFRPSLVVTGETAWAEDGWRRLRIGSALFRSVKGCDRCIMTVTDPDTGKRGKEPLRTLAKHRRWDGAPWFAMNLIPDTPGAVIRVGDEVEVLEEVPAPDGPPR